MKSTTGMAVPSDDRNGVVVNRASIDSTRGIPNRLIEERCSEKASAKSSSEIHAKSEYEEQLYSATTGTH